MEETVMKLLFNQYERKAIIEGNSLFAGSALFWIARKKLQREIEKQIKCIVTILEIYLK